MNTIATANKKARETFRGFLSPCVWRHLGRWPKCYSLSVSIQIRLQGLAFELCRISFQEF